MIAGDTNVVVYAHRAELPQHRWARARLRELAEGDARWGLPVFCFGEFVRVVTYPAVLRPPSTLGEAVTVLEGVLASPSLEVLSPGERYWPLLRDALRRHVRRAISRLTRRSWRVCPESSMRTLVTRTDGCEDRPGHRACATWCSAAPDFASALTALASAPVHSAFRTRHLKG